MRRNVRSLWIVLFALCVIPTASLAAGTPLNPSDALLPWTAESQYLVGRIDNVPELAKTILSWSALSGDASKELGLEDVKAILDGELNATSAFMTGKLTIDGSMGLAMKLGGVLS